MWLGHRLPDPPTDLVTYQEIMTTVRTDVVIETGTAMEKHPLTFNLGRYLRKVREAGPA